MVRAGLKLEPRLLALGCSSHSGSEEHLSAVREILSMASLDESALQCMLDKPLGEPERRAWGDKPATRISMNCSGKHAAMLLTCVTNGWPIENYLDPAHPLQVAIKAELRSTCRRDNHADFNRWLRCTAIFDFSYWSGACNSCNHNLR